jgi:hypothetical protein
MTDFLNCGLAHGIMKTDGQISFKNYPFPVPPERPNLSAKLVEEKAPEGWSTCIFLIVLLGSLERERQAGVLRPVATGRRMVFVGTCALCIRLGVMRLGACSTNARCPQLEPLLEHDNLKIIVARILQV